MNLCFVIVNESTTTDPAQGGALDDSTLSTIASAVEAQLNDDYAPLCGGIYKVRVGAKDGSDVDPSECAIWIKDSLPEAPGAAGYHAALPNGAPVEYIGRDGSNSLTSGPTALSVTISHECLEVAGNPGTNLWADDENGTEYARERCDAVESYNYQKNDVTVSDWLLDTFFTPGAPGPYSFARLQNPNAPGPSGPFQTAGADGGDYQIERSVDESGVHQVTAKGKINPLRVGKKTHWSSRTYRLGVRFTPKDIPTLPAPII